MYQLLTTNSIVFIANYNFPDLPYKFIYLSFIIKHRINIEKGENKL